jgi:hypothetical protein
MSGIYLYASAFWLQRQQYAIHLLLLKIARKIACCKLYARNIEASGKQRRVLMRVGSHAFRL